MRVGRISVVVRGVLTTTVFHTCTAAVRTLYATSARAKNTRASTCGYASELRVLPTAERHS